MEPFSDAGPFLGFTDVSLDLRKNGYCEMTDDFHKEIKKNKYLSMTALASMTRCKTEWVIMAFFLPLLRIQLSMACRRSLHFENTGHETLGRIISPITECSIVRAEMKCCIIQKSRARAGGRVHSILCQPSTYLVHGPKGILSARLNFPICKMKIIIVYAPWLTMKV